MMAERRVHFIEAVENANAQPEADLSPHLGSHVTPFPPKSAPRNGSAMATGGVRDALPIVELKPFFTQVWRREKSLPDFYLKTGSKVPPPANPDPLRATIQSEPSPAVVSLYREATGLVVKDVSLTSPRISVDRSEVTPKNGSRSRPHPPVEYSYNCVPKRSGGYIPEFIPRQGRAKSTMEETRREDSVTRFYSCVKHALTSEMMARQQEIRVEGGRMRQSLQRRQLLYLNPLHMYRGSRPYEGGYPLEKSSISPSSVFRRHEGDVSLKGLDSPQQSHRSPSRPHVSPRKSQNGDETPNSRRNAHPVRSEVGGRASRTTRRPFRLNTKIGGARDSLKILSESGPPTSVERQLTLQMEIDLERFRKLRQKELSPVEPAPGPKPYPSLISGLTRGELELQRGREANKNQRAREKAKKSFKEITFQRPQDVGEIPLPDHVEFTFRSGKGGGGDVSSNARRSPYAGLPSLGSVPAAGTTGLVHTPREDSRGVAAHSAHTLGQRPSQDPRDVSEDKGRDTEVRDRTDPLYAPASPRGGNRSPAHAPKQLPSEVLEPQEDEGRSSDEEMDDDDDDVVGGDESDGEEDDEDEDEETEAETELKGNVPPSCTSSTATPQFVPESQFVDAASSPMKFYNESPDTGIGVNGESDVTGKATAEDSTEPKCMKEGSVGFFKSTTFITNSQRDLAT